MITIVRIEHNNGQGCFTNDSYETVDMLCPSAHAKHFRIKEYCVDIFFPNPRNEGLNLNLNNKEWFCAFKSIEQLYSLFTVKEIKTLLNKGYKLLLLDVTEYQESPNQILYTKESILSSKVINNIFS